MDNWPYTEDGARDDDPANVHRFPVIETAWPRWRYITAVVVDPLLKAVRPTEDELLMVASFHEEYMTRWYMESYRRKLRERPFDIDGGVNGRFLMKKADGLWRYRQESWEYGPDFVPVAGGSLPEVLDWAHSIGDSGPTRSWRAWKAEHPEVFAAVAS